MINPVLKKLGLKPDDRAVIVHADDLGMCHAVNKAFWKNYPFGIVTSGSIMMPCSWAPEMAKWCLKHPKADVGVHLTLTSEWKGYRWKPISTCDSKSGLIDKEGYMWPSTQELHRHMNPKAAIAEMRAQIDRALALGIDVTHIDTHMGAAAHSELGPAYIELAVKYGVPALIPRTLPKEQLAQLGSSASEFMKTLQGQLNRLVAKGFPVLDYTCATEGLGGSLGAYYRLFDSLPAGITHLQTHPSVPGDDIKAITAGATVTPASERVVDYQTFLRPKLKKQIAKQGIHLIGYRTLRDIIREKE